MKLLGLITDFTPLAFSASSILRGGDLGTLIGALGTLLAVFAALAAMAFLSRRRRFSFFWGFLAALFSGAAMLLCVVSTRTDILVARPEGDPQAAVTGFFDALLAGDYDGACAYLKNCGSLGLEGSLEDEAGERMLEELRKSYSYRLYGDCARDRLTARQEVQFTYLDLTAFQDTLAEETVRALNEIVEERPRGEIYDSKNNYLPQVPREAYQTALESILADAGRYYTTATLPLELVYENGTWTMLPGENLLRAITGGVMR